MVLRICMEYLSEKERIISIWNNRQHINKSRNGFAIKFHLLIIKRRKVFTWCQNNNKFIIDDRVDMENTMLGCTIEHSFSRN